MHMSAEIQSTHFLFQLLSQLLYRHDEIVFCRALVGENAWDDGTMWCNWWWIYAEFWDWCDRIISRRGCNTRWILEDNISGESVCGLVFLLVQLQQTGALTILKNVKVDVWAGLRHSSISFQHLVPLAGFLLANRLVKGNISVIETTGNTWYWVHFAFQSSFVGLI